ncbi:hypothetical protein [Leucobacter sp. cx-169]|uniref:hypothetical protein n=1 Tax=Leucobacter sp. cx-169 TaxID=2770549 RepID=UPI00165D7F05|nr:hypothetical protein [Leucobacter sp. cx-169]MBC9927202.1 hypothetical protein [Leucobacter sp. cx-169]
MSKINADIERYREGYGDISLAIQALEGRLADALASATHSPEQGEASAAIERVRALACKHRSVEQHNETVPLSDIGDLIGEPSSAEYFAALDGAPEAEWEYGFRGRYAVMHPTKAGQRIETPEITQRTPDNWLPEMGEIYRRRPSTPAGPWLPAAGESE